MQSHPNIGNWQLNLRIRYVYVYRKYMKKMKNQWACINYVYICISICCAYIFYVQLCVTSQS